MSGKDSRAIPSFYNPDAVLNTFSAVWGGDYARRVHDVYFQVDPFNANFGVNKDEYICYAMRLLRSVREHFKRRHASPLTEKLLAELVSRSFHPEQVVLGLVSAEQLSLITGLLLPIFSEKGVLDKIKSKTAAVK